MDEIERIKRPNTVCEFGEFVIKGGHKGSDVSGVIRDDADAKQVW